MGVSGVEEGVGEGRSRESGREAACRGWERVVRVGVVRSRLRVRLQAAVLQRSLHGLLDARALLDARLLEQPDHLLHDGRLASARRQAQPRRGQVGSVLLAEFGVLEREAE